jgi:putative selenium metabolism protein SsnA
MGQESSQSTLLIENVTVATMRQGVNLLEDHAIYIKGDRIDRIVKTTNPELKTLPVDRRIDGKGKVAMPGLTNAHTHFYSSFARGLTKCDPAHNFYGVLQNLWWRLDQTLTLDDVHASAMVALVEAIKHGTTTMIDHHASPNAITGSLDRIEQAVMESGLRAALCYEVTDRGGSGRADEGIRENVRFIERSNLMGGNRIKSMFGLHASFTVTNHTMERIAVELDGKESAFHIHMAEDRYDQHFTRHAYGTSVGERLSRWGLLGDRTICAHGVHLSDEEIELLGESGTAVVHNPQSNMNNAVGTCDILKLQKSGVLVGLGTDAMTMNMLEEARAALWLQKSSRGEPSFPLDEITNMLLSGNQEITKRIWQESMGELSPNSLADIILIDYCSPTPLTSENYLGHLLFGMSQSRVDTTIASGKVLMEGGDLCELDEEKINYDAHQLSEKMWARL